jgi:hypothetical protein
MSVLDMYVKVKGYRKIEMGFVDVYCRHAGMGSSYKSKTNSKAQEMRLSGMSTTGYVKKSKNETTLQKIYDMTDSDWASALQLVKSEWRELSKSNVEVVSHQKPKRRLAATVTQAVNHSSKNEVNMLTQWANAGVSVSDLALLNGVEIDELAADLEIDSIMSAAKFNLEDFIDPVVSIVGANMRCRNANKEYCVFSKNIEATTKHCEHNFATRPIRSEVGRIQLWDNKKHSDLDKLYRIIANSFRSIRTIKSKDQWENVFRPGNSGMIIKMNVDNATQLLENCSIEFYVDRTGWHYVMDYRAIMLLF